MAQRTREMQNHQQNHCYMPTSWEPYHRLQSASKIFNANRWILCDTQVAIAKRLEYFDCVISPVACYAAGHRSIYKNDLHRFDVLQRRFLRSVVGPPRNIDWTLPWHEILHQWNDRIQRFMGQSRCKPWSEMCLRHHWNFAHYFALLPRPPVAQTGFALEPLWAQTGRTPARNILGTTSLEISAASKIYLHGRWLPWIKVGQLDLSPRNGWTVSPNRLKQSIFSALEP